MTRHNFYQKRSRLLKQLRNAWISYLWFCNETKPQSRRAATLAAKRMMEKTRDLWKLGNLPRGDSQ